MSKNAKRKRQCKTLEIMLFIDSNSDEDIISFGTNGMVSQCLLMKFFQRCKRLKMDRQYFEECKKQKSEKDIFVPTTKSEKPDLRVCILSSFRKVFFTSSDGADCSVIYIILKPFSLLFDKYKNIYQLTIFFSILRKTF